MTCPNYEKHTTCWPNAGPYTQTGMFDVTFVFVLWYQHKIWQITRENPASGYIQPWLTLEHGREPAMWSTAAGDPGWCLSNMTDLVTRINQWPIVPTFAERAGLGVYRQDGRHVGVVRRLVCRTCVSIVRWHVPRFIWPQPGKYDALRR